MQFRFPFFFSGQITHIVLLRHEAGRSVREGGLDCVLRLHYLHRAAVLAARRHLLTVQPEGSD